MAVVAAWVGIDAGKAKHHAVAIDGDGDVLWSVKVDNDQQAIVELLARAAAVDGEVRWAVDLTSPVAALLLGLLLHAGQRVVFVPGRTVNRMAGAFRGEGKTDAKDARIIAETARMRHRDLTVVTAPDDLAIELSRLTAHRSDLSAEWVRGVNRLRELLTSVFPALERAFDFTTRSALMLVSEYCTPTALRSVDEEQLAAQLARLGARNSATMAVTAVRAASGQDIVLPGEATTALLIKRLARQLLELDRSIRDTSKLIAERFRTHPQATIIESLPGMGPILGAELVAMTGGDPRALFANPGRLAAQAGLVPVPKDSGRVSGNLHRPKRYHRGLRRVFFMAALSSIKAGGASSAYYQRKRGENRMHQQAILALARRLVDVLWALLRDNRTFSPAAPTHATT
ncbi:IS110 family transposase [Dactylosporangium sp. NPDC050588]|uniref:IS110 family transposase n=1 Tax=Dactylosporangium sp. NPDC050588 TaxID=3157211 RepID=UPI0034048108